MARWSKHLFLTVLVLIVGYLLTVQVLRWIAFGEEEREALALMAVGTAEPAGPSGFKYLAFPGRDIPDGELDQALAADLAAYREWHAGWGARLLEQGLDSASNESGSYKSPVTERYPERPPVDIPEAACGLRESNCLAKLRGHEDAIRVWLREDAQRLERAEKALHSDNLANPYPSSVDSPIAGFQALRLPVNAIALQGLDGDVAGATVRACRLLAAERRFLSQGAPLIDTMVHGALVDGAAGLLLGLRRLDPAAAMPVECAQAMAPVVAEDYLACDAFRHEHAMVASLSTAMDRAMRKSWNPTHWLTRWALADDKLMRAWSARNFVPMCDPDGIASILAGRVPEPRESAYDTSSVDYWAAPISHILAAVAAPAYGKYQDRLLDQAASLRLQLAAIAAVSGAVAPEQVPVVAASPGYEITIENDQWVLPLREPQARQAPTLRVALPQ